MIDYRIDDEATHPGGVDIAIPLTRDEWTAIGHPGAVVDQLDTVLWAIAVLRTGHTVRSDEQREITAQDLHAVIRDTDKLSRLLKAVTAAAIRRHADLGGSYGDLAQALDVKRSAAQYRRDTLLATDPSPDEQWVTGTLPRHRFAIGDHVRVVQLVGENRDFPKLIGRTGTVEGHADGLYVVRGLSNRVQETVMGRWAFTADELAPADNTEEEA